MRLKRNDDLARRFQLGEQTEWRKLLKHLEFSPKFSLVLLLTPDSEAAGFCRDELSQYCQDHDRLFHEVTFNTPDDLMRLPEHFLEIASTFKPACLWVEAVAPDYQEDFIEWREAWESSLAKLNAYRNVIRDSFNCSLLFVGAPWLQQTMRESAPDLWSVRTIVVRIQAAESNRGGADLYALQLGKMRAAPDPDFALARAKSLIQEQGKELEAAKMFSRAGEGFQAKHDHRSSKECFSEALKIQDKHGAPIGDVLTTLHHLAWSLMSTGSLQEALEVSSRLLDQANAVNSDEFRNIALSEIGLASTYLGYYDDAVTFQLQSMELSRSRNDASGLSTDLNNLGNTYFKLNNFEDALRCFEEALALKREQGDKEGEGHVLGSMGLVYTATGDVKRAISFFERALDIHRATADISSQSTSLGNLANSYSISGDHAKALDLYRESLDLALQTGDRRSEARGLSNMALTLRQLGEIETAISLNAQALELYESMHDPEAPGIRERHEQWTAGGGSRG